MANTREERLAAENEQLRADLAILARWVANEAAGYLQGVLVADGGQGWIFRREALPDDRVIYEFDLSGDET